MKSIIYRDNCSITKDFLLSVYILTENQKYKFNYIKLLNRQNNLLLEMDCFHVYKNLSFERLFYKRDNKISNYNNEEIIKIEIFGKTNKYQDLQLEYSIAGKEATYIIVNNVENYYTSIDYSDNLAKNIFKIDYCNHEYIPLFTGYCCRYCGKER
jgi:hypothetical protein